MYTDNSIPITIDDYLKFELSSTLMTLKYISYDYIILGIY